MPAMGRMLAMAAAIVPLASPRAQACISFSPLSSHPMLAEQGSSPLAFHFPRPHFPPSPLSRCLVAPSLAACRTSRTRSVAGASLHSNRLLMQEDSGMMMENWKLALEKAAEKWRYRQRETFVDNELYEREWVTPLWMITQEPDLNNLVKYLQEMRLKINDAPDQVHVIQFSRAQIEAAREAFSRMVRIFHDPQQLSLLRQVRSGEMRLHRLCELIGSEIFSTSYSRQVVVVGQRNGARSRLDSLLTLLVQSGPKDRDNVFNSYSRSRPRSFTLRPTWTWDPVRWAPLTRFTSLAVQLERFMWQDSINSWTKASLVANFVEYEALQADRVVAHRRASV
eukprot:752096-Hanusia_phi.AAC.4